MSSRPHTIHAAFDDEAAKHWSEGTSRLFIDNGRYFVPERDHQMRIVAALLSYLEGSCVILELCCGDGLLAEVLLDSFPAFTVHGVDVHWMLAGHACSAHGNPRIGGDDSILCWLLDTLGDDSPSFF